MRTLAPIRVRRCDCDQCGGERKYQQWRCRICGTGYPAYDTDDAIRCGLTHLRQKHPWPWANAQLDTDGSGK